MTNPLDTILDVLQGYENLAQRYLLCDLFIEEGNYTQAQTLIDAAESDMNLNAREAARHQEMKEGYDIWLELLNNNATSLSAAQENELLALSTSKYGPSSALATSLLMRYNQEFYLEPLYAPEMTLRSFADAYQDADDAYNLLNVYPNPAKDYITVEFQKWEKDVQISLFDANGKVVFQRGVKSGNGIELIDINGLASGTYQILVQSGTHSQTERLEIIR